MASVCTSGQKSMGGGTNGRFIRLGARTAFPSIRGGWLDWPYVAPQLARSAVHTSLSLGSNTPVSLRPGDSSGISRPAVQVPQVAAVVHWPRPVGDHRGWRVKHCGDMLSVPDLPQVNIPAGGNKLESLGAWSSLVQKNPSNVPARGIATRWRTRESASSPPSRSSIPTSTHGRPTTMTRARLEMSCARGGFPETFHPCGQLDSRLVVGRRDVLW